MCIYIHYKNKLLVGLYSLLVFWDFWKTTCSTTSPLGQNRSTNQQQILKQTEHETTKNQPGLKWTNDIVLWSISLWRE